MFVQGTSVVRVRAEDGDHGQRNVTYSLEGESIEIFCSNHFIDNLVLFNLFLCVSMFLKCTLCFKWKIASRFTQYFAIDEMSGEISLRKPVVDLKKVLGSGNPLLLPVKAQEIDDYPDQWSPMTSTTVQLAFAIISSRNHAPRFTNDSLIGFISSKSLPLTSVRWDEGSIPQVIDADPGINGTIALFIEKDTGTFSIQPNQGTNELTFTLVVKDNSLIDFEKMEKKSLSFMVSLLYITLSFKKALSLC